MSTLMTPGTGAVTKAPALRMVMIYSHKIYEGAKGGGHSQQKTISCAVPLAEKLC